MKGDQLLAMYDRVSGAEDAIPRLRRFVLDLAVRGKLVEQDAGDEPASVLLERIEAEKAKNGNRNAQRKVGANPNALHLYPRHWVGVTIESILLELQTGPFGSSLHKKDYVSGGTPVINPASIQNGRIIPIETMAIGPDTLKRLASFKLRNGDIVMARRGEMGRCALVEETEAGWLCGTGSLILRPSTFVHGPFLVLLIGSPTSREYLGGSAVGSTMQNLNQSILLGLPFALPPLAEQHRIVAKVQELMALLDGLEAARGRAEGARDKLTAATLHRLTDEGTDPQTATAFALQTLPALTTRPDQIKPLRQTILNLAVRGKLVAQDPADEPASVLLERVTVKKREIARSAGHKLKKPIPRDDRFIEAPLPDKWVWSQLDELAWKITDGDHQTPKREGSGRYLLSARNVLDGQIDVSNVDFVGDAEFKRMRLRCDPDKYDILISCSGSVGRVAIVDRDNAYVLVRSAALVKLTAGEELSGYLQKVLLSDILKDQIDTRSKAAAQPNLFLGQIRQLMLPLPPLAEQRRIVAKVDALMALCDQLETALTTTVTTRSRLLDTLIRSALSSDVKMPEAAE